ncbi:SLOG family protein [Butyricicoccus pullicaecorum]|uniref:SLOG family protein n=1 Tax=Butyricicoccus pullicaecorum TaxID=501571 RepID=UPI0039907FCA
MLVDIPYDPAHTCCFSGSRPEKLGFDWQREPYFLDVLRTDLRTAIRHAVELEYHRFITGMSRGFDLWAAEEVINLQREFPHLELICALPFHGMSSRWEPYWREMFTRAHEGADYEVYLSDRFLPGCYHARDNYMVQQSSRVICWNNGTSGGTAYTCKYAERRGITLDNIHRPYYGLSAMP